MIRQIFKKIFTASLAMILLFNYNVVLADSTVNIKKKYNVKLHYNYNSGKIDEIKDVEEGRLLSEVLTAEQKSPAKKEYEFLGWYKNNDLKEVDKYDLEKTKVESSLNLYAKWKEKAKFTIKFDSNGGGAVNNQIIYSGEKAIKPSNPIKKDYSFKGWYKETALSNEYNFDIPVTSDMTLYGKWQKNTSSNGNTNGKDKKKETYVIDFDTDGGTKIEKVKVKEGEKLKKPKDPYKAGYKFEGWYTSRRFRSSDEYDFSDSIDDDFTLYADWKDDKDTTEIDFVVYGDRNNKIEEERDYVVGKDETIMKISEGVFNKKNKYMDKEKTKEDKDRDKRNKVEFKKKNNTFISIDGIENTKEFKWQVYVNDRLIEEKEIEKYGLRYGDKIKWSFDYIYPGSQPTEPIVSKSKGKYINGYSDKTFRPENYISREEVATVIHKLIDKKQFKDLDEKMLWFYDVEPGRWSENDISDLAKLRVMNGYGDKNFRPTAYISRGEVAVILSRINGLQGSNNNIFVDTQNYWGNMEINAVADQGWIRGYKDRTFKPNSFITRAEFVSMVNSSLGLRRGKTTKKSPFTDVYPGKWYYHEILLAI